MRRWLNDHSVILRIGIVLFAMAFVIAGLTVFSVYEYRSFRNVEPKANRKVDLHARKSQLIDAIPMLQKLHSVKHLWFGE